MSKLNQDYLRSVIFGIEDSLVSITGLVAGMSVGVANKELVLLAGTMAVFVEALSMAAGEYLSDEAVQELDKVKRTKESPLKSSLLMFVSYLTAGMIPILPVILLPFPQALWISVTGALFGLFLLGFIKGRILHISAAKSGLKILVIGGSATLIGVIIGLVFRV